MKKMYLVTETSTRRTVDGSETILMTSIKVGNSEREIRIEDEAIRETKFGDEIVDISELSFPALTGEEWGPCLSCALRSVLSNLKDVRGANKVLANLFLLGFEKGQSVATSEFHAQQKATGEHEEEETDEMHGYDDWK